MLSVLSSTCRRVKKIQLGRYCARDVSVESMTHKEGIRVVRFTESSVIQLFREQGLIRSERVLDTCFAINPRLFAKEQSENECSKEESLPSYVSAEEVANAMIAYIVTLELLQEVFSSLFLLMRPSEVEIRNERTGLRNRDRIHCCLHGPPRLLYAQLSLKTFRWDQWVG